MTVIRLCLFVHLRYSCKKAQPKMELMNVCVYRLINTCTHTPIIEFSLFFYNCPLVHFSP